jgi:hypothetical protein
LGTLLGAGAMGFGSVLMPAPSAGNAAGVSDGVDLDALSLLSQRMPARNPTSNPAAIRAPTGSERDDAFEIRGGGSSAIAGGGTTTVSGFGWGDEGRTSADGGGVGTSATGGGAGMSTAVGGAGTSTAVPLAAQKSSRFFRLVATKG